MGRVKFKGIKDIGIIYTKPAIKDTLSELEGCVKKKEQVFKDLDMIDDQMRLYIGKLVYYLSYKTVFELTGVHITTLQKYFKLYLQYMEKNGYTIVETPSGKKTKLVKNEVVENDKV